MKNFFFLNKISSLKMILLGKKIYICKGVKIVYKGINKCIDINSGSLILGLSHYKNAYYKKSIINIKGNGKIVIDGDVRIFTRI